MFVDQVRIHAKAGDGGSGSASFRREKFIPKGGPDGGDGGHGGDIVLVADEHTDDLVALYYEPIIRAKDGARGMGQQKSGKSAPRKDVHVPVGTVIYRLPEELGPNRPPAEFDAGDARPRKPQIDLAELEVAGDLTAIGQRLVLCKGGAGGKGNVHFKSSRNRAPRQFTEGVPGEAGVFLLELRQIADVGLVGYPNAGKSTLLGSISAAHPKIAPYPFTTLHPHVGVVGLDGFQRVTVADIPGLVEGAHRNVGLGHDFLRHIVRCRLLAFVLDIAGSEGREPVADLESLRKEISLYDINLARRPWIVVANKIDLPGAEEKLAQFRQRFPGREVWPVSAQEGAGIAPFRRRLGELVLEGIEVSSRGHLG